MNIGELFQDHAKLEISDDSIYNNDLYVYSIYTSDGYNVWVIKDSSDFSDIDPENDLFYYEPSFADIMDRVEDYRWDKNETFKIYVEDVETFFPEYEMSDWLDNNVEDWDYDEEL